MIVDFNDFASAIPDGRHRVRALREQYTNRFGATPEVVVSAPGRTEIIGNHTDHNNGRVVAAAISQDVLVVAGSAPKLTVVSDGWDREFTVTSWDENLHDTEKLMLGVQAGLKKHALPAPGYRACLESSVRPGSGLSSSAALVVALAGVHGALAGQDIPPLQAALAGRYAENTFMGKPSGLMDQLVSALGGMQAIDFESPESPLIHRVDVSFTSTNHHLLVVHTGGSHADLTENYGSVSREMHEVARALGVRTLAETSRKHLLGHLTAVRRETGDRAVLRALHFFEEQSRVSAFVDSAASRQNLELLRLMTESGESSVRLLQNVHTGSARDQGLALGLELTRTYLQQRGGVGAYRVHGGGFAGTMLAVMPEDLVQEYTNAMHRAFGDDAVMPLKIRERGLIAAPLTESQ